MKKSKNETDNKVHYGTISLPLPLIKRIKEAIHGTGMGSVSAYVTFILREILSSPIPEEKSSILSNEKKRIVIDRLKKLGYI